MIDIKDLCFLKCNMPNIVTITFSPSIDKTTSVKKLIAEKKLHCSEPTFEPGGGGINIARAVKKLGGEAVAVYPAGGYTGHFFTHLLEKEKIPTIVIGAEHPMRENVVVVEEESNAQFRFGFPGAKLNEFEWQRCLEEIEKLDGTEYIVASGSIPQGVPHDVFARLAAIAKDKNDKLIVDTSGDALKLATEIGVYMMKPNVGELARLLGKHALSANEVPDAGREIINQGKCEVLVISMGKEGAMLLTKDVEFIAKAPKAKKRSTVGAGDSMVAGIVLQLSRGKRIEEAFLYGIASGTGATMNHGTGLCRKEDVDELYQQLLSQYWQNLIVST